MNKIITFKFVQIILSFNKIQKMQIRVPYRLKGDNSKRHELRGDKSNNKNDKDSTLYLLICHPYTTTW